MEIKVIKDEGKELVLEFETPDLTIPDLLAHELLNDSDVSFAGVSKDHPETGKPRLVVKTSRGKPAGAISDAIESIGKNVKELKAVIAKKR